MLVWASKKSPDARSLMAFEMIVGKSCSALARLVPAVSAAVARFPYFSSAGRRASFNFHGRRLGRLRAHSAPIEGTHKCLGEWTIGRRRRHVRRCDAVGRQYR